VKQRAGLADLIRAGSAAPYMVEEEEAALRPAHLLRQPSRADSDTSRQRRRAGLRSRGDRLRGNRRRALVLAEVWFGQTA
jgi:hypothetical protein